MKQQILYILLVLSVSVHCTFSQEKFEKEYRVKTIEVPKNALQIIEMWNFPKKVKWYVEESNDGKTFEAKSCLKPNRVSVEFSEKGELLDAEITIKFSKLSDDLQHIIRKSLGERFKKIRIKKIQIQYSGAESAIYKAIFKRKMMEPLQPKYELIIRGKKENKMETFEILISNKGKILKELKFKPSNSINLEF